MNDNEFARLISKYFYPHFPYVRIEHGVDVCRVYATDVEPAALGGAVLAFRHDVIIRSVGTWNGESFVSWDEVQP